MSADEKISLADRAVFIRNLVMPSLESSMVARVGGPGVLLIAHQLTSFLVDLAAEVDKLKNIIEAAPRLGE